jgi:oligoendopeptidase F
MISTRFLLSGGLDMSDNLTARKDVPEDLTWDLTALFADEAAYEVALASIAGQASSIEQTYRSRIASAVDPALVLSAVQAAEQYAIAASRAGYYAHLAYSVDRTDEVAGTRFMAYETFIAEIESRLSFLDSELMETPDDTLAGAIRLDSRYAAYFNDIRRRKRHKLSPETEKVLAALSPVLHLPETVYEQTKHTDMAFGTFEAGGRTLPLSFVLFENDYNLDADPDIRRNAFQAFSSTLAKYQNTVAAVYNGEVQRQKTLSRLRGYESVFDYLLDDQKVDRALYDRQIDVILSDLAPHMRRYAKLLQKTHGLDKMTFADLKISLDPDFDPKVTVEESKSYISNALRVMGPEYHSLVMRSYSERWVDFAQNIGKSTGGFCASPYGTHGFILLSWTGRLSEVFTLAHELGHAAHFSLAEAENPYLVCEPSLYFVEAPSTCNEMLLVNDMLKMKDDPRFQRFVLASMIQNTYYHNFVTHLLEAAYQREVYRRVDGGGSLQAADLSAIKRQILQDFWGDAVEINEGAELTWMRQPHYYRGLYPYTYSAGLTIATEVSQRILREGEPAVQDWLRALRAAGTVTPVEFAAIAGVDITTEKPLRNTIAFIGQMIDRIENQR